MRYIKVTKEQLKNSPNLFAEIDNKLYPKAELIYRYNKDGSLSDKVYTYRCRVCHVCSNIDQIKVVNPDFNGEGIYECPWCKCGLYATKEKIHRG